VKGLEREYSQQNLKVIWIGFQDREDKIREFMERHGVSSVAYDRGDRVAEKYGIKYGAGLVFINRKGIVVKRVPKGFSEKEMRVALEIALKDEVAK
jgi:hypothetical protein